LKAIRNNGMRYILIFCLLCLLFIHSGCKLSTVDDGGNNNNGSGGIQYDDQWEELGPAPIGDAQTTGRVAAIGISQQNADLYYIGAADGGVWKSTDGGTSWTALTDHLPTTAIGAVAVDPNNDQIVYAGSGEANFANHSRYGLGIYKTTDGGNNWQVLASEVFSGRCFSSLKIAPDNTETLYAAITHAGGLPSYDFNIAGARGHSGAGLPLGVWKSVDSGTSWVQMFNGIPTDLSVTDLIINPNDSSILFAAVAHIFGNDRNGIYKSTDRGDSWTKLSGRLPTTGFGRIALTISTANSERIYASIIRACDATGGGSSTLAVYRSDDGGNSWVAKDPGSVHATYGWYLNVITVSPTNPDTVYLGGLNLFKTIDGGDSWSNVTGNQHVDFHALIYDAGGRILSGNDGGIYRSENDGNSWKPLNRGLGIIQFYAGISLDPNNVDIIYAGSQDNGTLKRTGNDKNSWISILGGDGGCTGIIPDDSSIVLAEYQGAGNIYKSRNYGAGMQTSGNGISRSDPSSFIAPFVMDQLNPGHIYYATNRMYRSVDSGSSWQAVSVDVTGKEGAAIRGFAVAPSDSAVIYAGTNDGRILVSSDRGSNWQLRLTGIPGWPRIMRQWAIDETDPNTAYLAVSFFGEDQVMVTRDNGLTWDSLDNNLADIPVNTICLDPSDGSIYIGTDAGVFRSNNGGGSWQRYGSGLPNCAVNDMKLDIINKRLVVATQGRGMWAVGID
jgi:photosystem II stability/assembly factor-like uncharacterized protein